ncbi:MAG: tRNA (guanosine(37)-N1)-methyltransferase TrmD [Mycoplasmoidaceae bacterium]
MRITILTLFPSVINEYINSSIIKRAIDNNSCTIEVVNFREFSKNKHKKVDGYQFGGGGGMVLSLQPIVDAIRFYKKENSKVILLTPSGKKYKSSNAKKLALEKNLIFIAGHYEGFDERLNNYIDEEISIGDYVLTGGELPALVIVDSIVRLIPDVINKESLISESFEDNLLDYPVYTKPINFEGYKVPEILISGNHKSIEKFRYESKLAKTKLNRYDLYKEHITNKKGINNE